MRIALAGIGGYGHHYLGPLLDESNAHRLSFVAGIDPHPQACRRLSEIQARRVPVYASLDGGNVSN